MHHGAMKFLRYLALAAMLCTWALVGTASAADFTLYAEPFTKTMPDGQVVTMWGYTTTSGQAAIEFPLVLTVPAGDNTLNITLHNNLPPGEFTSLLLNGFVDSNPAPVFLPAAAGQPQRARSFTHEAAAGGQDTYTWTIDRPGTFLLQSGSHVSAQVPMGLYAVVKKNAVDGVSPAGEAYGATTPFQNEVVFLFSEVDPALNNAVATGILGTPAYPSTISYEPKYFLVNGDPFPFGDTHTWVGDVNQDALVRFVNAGLSTRAPTVVGGHWRLVAEDGFPYVNEKLQSSLDLTAGKTLDIIGTSAVQGYFPIYDRTLGTTNADTSTGGMLTYLEIGPSHLTPGSQAILTITKTGLGTGTVQSASLPGGIICALDPLVGCSEHYLPGTELRLTAVANPGSVFAGWTGCTPIAGLNDCLVTLAADTTVTASFIQATTRVGVFRAGQWFLDKGDLGWQNTDTVYPAPGFGAATDIPVAGDMNGDGVSEVGVYRPATGAWYFDLDGNGAWSGCGLDLCLTAFGAPTDLPVVGDWDGNGRDEVGVYRQGQWYFDMDGNGTWNPAIDAFKQAFGAPSDLPVAGDWNGDGKDEIGVYRQGTWYLDNGNGRWDDPADPTVTNPDTVYASAGGFGAATDLPVAGEVNNDGRAEVGVYRPSTGQWYFDLDNSGTWGGCLDAGGLDLCVPPFGAPTDKPVVGTWR